MSIVDSKLVNTLHLDFDILPNILPTVFGAFGLKYFSRLLHMNIFFVVLSEEILLIRLPPLEVSYQPEGSFFI